MKYFKDTKGREWCIDINVLTLKKIKASCGVDLMDVVSFDEENGLKTGLLDKLGSDVCLLVDVLFSACKEQADRDGVSDEEFAKGLNGDVIDDASGKLLDELVDFFPFAKRKMMTKVMTASRKMRSASEKKMMELLDSGLLEKEVDEKIKEIENLPLTEYGDESTNAPESAE